MLGNVCKNDVFLKVGLKRSSLTGIIIKIHSPGARLLLGVNIT